MKKEFIFLPIILLVGITLISIYLVFKDNDDVIYKKDIFVQTSYNKNCERQETEHNLNAVHLSYNKNKFKEKYADVFFNEEKVGSFFIDHLKSIVYYQNIFEKNMHLETLFEVDNNYRIFLYLEQYPLVKKNLDKKILNISLRFKSKNDSSEYSNIMNYNINTEKYLKDKNFHKIDFNIDEYKNKIKVSASSETNDPYEIMVQFKKDNTFYNQQHFDCKANKCKNMPVFFNIEEQDVYLGVLIFDRSQKEYTYEYKKEYFVDKKSKYCFKKNAKDYFQ